MFFEALLLAILTIICTIDTSGPQTAIYRPLFAGAITGLILGDFRQGLIISATLELMWLGVVGVGAYTPPDIISGAIVGTAIGIISGEGAVAGVAIAVPVAVVCQQLDMLAKTLDISFAHKADKAASEGNLGAIDLYPYLSLGIICLFKAVPVFLAILVGGEYVSKLFSYIPQVVLDGLSAAGGVLPAVGFGMLLSLMLKKNMWIFLLVGFVCSVYGNMPTIGIALIGIIMAVLYVMFNENKEMKKVTETVEIEESGGYDL